MRLSAVILVVAILWLGWRVAELERQRYAMIAGMCAIEAANPRSLKCLRSAQPRTSVFWNFYYGLFD